jgi:hypothetical protein
VFGLRLRAIASTILVSESFDVMLKPLPRSKSRLFCSIRSVLSECNSMDERVQDLFYRVDYVCAGGRRPGISKSPLSEGSNSGGSDCSLGRMRRMGSDRCSVSFDGLIRFRYGGEPEKTTSGA